MEKFGRYLVFNVHQYYPSGGLMDVCFSSDDKEEAIYKAKKCNGDSVQVWDRIEDEIVYDNEL